MSGQIYRPAVTNTTRVADVKGRLAATGAGGPVEWLAAPAPPCVKRVILDGR